jgi:hypothetical protein
MNDIKFTELSDLAAKCARQRDEVQVLRRTVKLAEDALRAEEGALNGTEERLRALIGPGRPRVLIPLGHGRFMLVHVVAGLCGSYSSIEIIEEESE